MASSETVVEKLRGRFPDSIQDVTEFRGETTVRVSKEAIVDICRFLHDDPDLAFNHLTDVTAVDYLDRTPRFDVVYHMFSIPHKVRLRLKAGLADGETIDSVTVVWPGAGWMEDETYDMFGIAFEGHPDLRRILMPEDWDGHPFRKDYPLRGYEGAAERWFEKQMEMPEEE